MPKLTLLVLAAGMGSRYGGLKQVDPMGPSGETLLDYSVSDALRVGFERIVFIIRRDIEAEFRERIGSRYKGNVAVDYVFQQLDFLPNGFSVPADRTKPWGTAHAIWCAREAVTKPFAAINADDFYGRETYEVIGKFLKVAAPASPRFAMAGYRLDHTLSEHGSVARGVCQVDASGKLVTISECTGLERLERRREYLVTPDDHIVIAGRHVTCGIVSDCFLQPPADTVALNGIAGLPGDSETDARAGCVAAIHHFQQE